MRYVLALDQGTTSSRAIVFDERGAAQASAKKEFRQHFPQPGWVEHDCGEILRTQLACARAALKKAKLAPKRVAAIGITNQRETTVVWDRRTGNPVHRAIVWQDRRTAARCDALKREGLDKTVQAKTGLVIDPYFSATKIEWLLDNVAGLRARAEQGDLAFGTVDTWLAWQLSGGELHVTDPSNASRTMLYDIHRGEWDEELLRMFRVPRSMLPQVLPSSQVYGATAKNLLGAEVPIAGVAGDQQAALFGQACFEPGMAKNTYGTGCFLLMNTGRTAIAPSGGLLATVAWRIGAETVYTLEGSVFIAGAAIQWLRDGLGVLGSAAESQRLAESVPDTGGVYLVPAFVGLGAPYWDMHARGAIFGLTRGTTRAHLVRAALEAIAYQSRDVLETMRAEAGVPLRALRVDGGAAANDFLCQFQADVMRVEVLRPSVIDTTSLGAAYLAGLGAGIWGSLAEVAHRWEIERRV